MLSQIPARGPLTYPSLNYVPAILDIFIQSVLDVLQQQALNTLKRAEILSGKTSVTSFGWRNTYALCTILPPMRSTDVMASSSHLKEINCFSKTSLLQYVLVHLLQ